MKLSDHFTLDEFTHSGTAIRLDIDQTPPPLVINNLMSTAMMMERVRTLLGNKPIHITSGYRSTALNKIVSPTNPTSSHLTGEAIDFICPEFGTPKEIVKFLSECPVVDFDQLIFEGTWVHIGFGTKARREVLTAHFNNGRATYSKGVA